MKHLKTWEDRNDLNTSYDDILLYINERVKLGSVKPFKIENELYKSGDYICSSFKIDGRDVIVSSIVIKDSDTLCIESGRHYKTLGDIVLQFGIKTDKYLYVGFGEHLDKKYNYDKNVNDNNTLFRKMTTIIEIIKSMVDYHNVDYIIFNSVDNDDNSGLSLDYNKRDKFYEIFIAHNNIEYHKIKSKISIGDEIISDFYILKIK